MSVTFITNPLIHLNLFSLHFSVILLLCNFSWGDMIQHLFTPCRWPTTDQRGNFARVQHSELMSLLGLLTGVWLWGLYRSLIAQRELPPESPGWLAAQENCIPGVPCTTYQLFTWSQSPLPNSCPCVDILGKGLVNCVTFGSFLSLVRSIHFLGSVYFIYFRVL